MPGNDNYPLKPRFSGLIIILLIISAALAFKYHDLQTEIHSVRLNSMASSLSAASARNFAAALIGSDQALTVKECRDVAGLLQGITGYESGEHPFTREYRGHHITDLEGGNDPGIPGSLCRLADSKGNWVAFQVHFVNMGK